MSFCDKCNVKVEENQSHCPLCGRCVNESLVGFDKPVGRFPDYTSFKRHRMHVSTVLLRILLVLVVATIGVNLLLDWGNFWCLYVVAGGVATCLGVLVPIRFRLTLASQTRLQTVAVALIIIVAEVFSKTFGWGVGYVIPFFMLSLIIVSAIMTIAKGYVEFDYVRPTIFLFVCSVLLYVLNRFVFFVPAWPALVAALASLVVILSFFMFRYKRTMKSLKKFYKY